ncbi:hypothetical protein AAHC03_0973 [Spirometra sp. Aus1]
MNHLEDAMFLEQLGVCKLCQMRLLDGPTFHSYSFPRQYMNFLTDKVDSVCVVCFGLLQTLRISHALGPVNSSGDIISQIIQVVLSTSYRFSGFQLNVSEPADISLRDRAVWALLADRHQQAAGDKKPEGVAVAASVAVPAKVVFRNLVYTLLKEELSKLNVIHKTLFENDTPWWFDSSTEQVSILVTFNLLDPSGVSKLYMDRLTDAIKKTCEPRLWSSFLSTPKKPRKRRPFGKVSMESSPPETSTVSRTSIKQLLPLLPDNVFLQKVIHLQQESSELSRQSIRVQLLSVEVSRIAPLIIAGRYVKLCRKLPQTPWILEGERKLEASVEELIAAPIVSAFGPGTKYTFVSSGREDIDVRCLGLGRPFMLEISSYAHTLASMLTEESKRLGNHRHHADAGDSAENGAEVIDISQLFPAPGDLSWMARRINLSTDCRVFVRDLQVMPLASANASLKQGEFEKSKRYRAVCWCSDGGISTERVRRLEAAVRVLSDLPTEESALQWPPQSAVADPGHSNFIELPGWEINQLTPIRVLHRRTLACRRRKIHWVRLADFSCVLAEDVPFELQDFHVWTRQYPAEELFLLELCCEAGTYVKELVHGDFGRTQPNLSSLIGCQVDLLALDVVAVEHDWPPCLPDPGL